MLILLNAKTNIKITNNWNVLLLRSTCTKFFLDIKKQVNIICLLLKSIVSRYLSTIRQILINVSFLANSIIRLLISYENLVDATNKKKKIILYYVARSRNYSIFRVLLICDVNKRIRN